MAKDRVTQQADGMDVSGECRYVAFLRGINVGGHRKIKMSDLARMFSDMGFGDVRTVIASGNVVFSSVEADGAALTATIEQALERGLGYPVDVMLRTLDWLRELVARDPFSRVADEESHRYVSFLQALRDRLPDLPADAVDGSYTVLAVHDRDVVWLSRKMPNGRHGDAGPYIARHIGAAATARNWNTVVKIAEL